MARPSDSSDVIANGKQRGFFAIADITGYTVYLADNELLHAQGILAEITELLIKRLSAPFRFVELEGDAVFVFAPDFSVDDAERLVEILENCYVGFRILQEQMLSNTSCTCQACRAIKDLDRKCVAHFGEFVAQQTPHGVKPVGRDVILTHRLLKNTVIEKTAVSAYAFLTDAFVARTNQPEQGLGAPSHSEAYAELGTVAGRVVDLSKALERDRTEAGYVITPEQADVQIDVTFPAPRSLVWAYHLDAERRLKWQLDTTEVENVVASSGRTEVGASSYCDHGNYRLTHRWIDWQPFDFLCSETISTGASITKPPSCKATFVFDELPDGGCHVSMRVRANSRNILMLAMLKLIAPIIRRTWQGHYVQLRRLLAEDMARTDLVAQPKTLEMNQAVSN